LRIDRTILSLFILQLLFNLGGAFSLVPFLDRPASVTFVIVSFYLGLTAVFFAAIMHEHTEARLEIIRKAWIFGALLASACAVAGYFGIAGTADLFTRYGRAAGTFKDPNVFGPFVMVPAVLLIQGFMTGSIKRPILALVALSVLLTGIFLSFSRGAWGVTLASCLLTGALLFVTTRSQRTRLRILIMSIVGLAVTAAAVAAALTIDVVRETFEIRFALAHEYDVGPQGRFGKLADAILLLLERPNGVGPLRFADYFPEAPHNVYVNAFASYGWLGGLSYLCLIAVTLRLGWSTVWRRTPWQCVYIALWSATFCQILQGLTIDTDHWRHLWLLIGLTWGLAAVARSDAPSRGLSGRGYRNDAANSPPQVRSRVPVVKKFA
jgi:O-antigen ligase